MKRVLSVLFAAALILCGCADAEPKSGDVTDVGQVTDLPSGSEAEDTAESATEVLTEEPRETEPAAAEPQKTAIPDVSGRPQGREVTIFRDNTIDCDYSGYEEIAYNFHDLRRSVMAPKGWTGFRFYEEDNTYFENQLTGIPIYDGPLPVEIDIFDYTTMFANQPMTESVFFLAEYPWLDPYSLINSSSEDNLSKYDHETYTDAKGRTMQVYFLDGLPKYAVYDDFFSLCIWFNLDSEDEIPVVVNMINSVEVTMSFEGEQTLKHAEKLGYTIIPPEE